MATNIKNDLKDFPCIFNCSYPGVVRKKLDNLNKKLERELCDNISIEERVQILNVLTWIQYQLNKYQQDASLQRYDRIFQLLSSNQQVDTCALANKAYLFVLIGERQQASDVLDTLKRLKSQQNYKQLESQALANQAYIHWRLGGWENLSKGQKLYEKAIQGQPGESSLQLYKFQLARLYRMLAHPNMFYLLSHEFNREVCLRDALENLKQVAMTTSDANLKGCCYAEMVYYTKTNMLSYKENNNIIEQAIDFAKFSEDCMMLSTLGRFLPFSHPHKIPILEKCWEITKSTTVGHSLAKYYALKAKKEEVSKIDQITRKALKYFEEANSIDNGLNVVAKYDYAEFLKQRGFVKEALDQFDQLLFSSNTAQFSGYRDIISKSYQQSAQCLMKLNRNADKETQRRLMKAASISADLATSSSNKEAFHWDIWRSFINTWRTVDRRDIKDDDTFNFVEIMRGREVESLEVVQKLVKMDGQDDEKFIEMGLKSYLSLSRYDEALTFLRLAQTRRSAFESDIWQREPLSSLSLKVQMKCAEYSLQTKNHEAKMIFNSMFRSEYPGDKLDVLIMYDDSWNTAESLTRATLAARKLENTLTDQFLCDVSINLQVS